MKRALSNILAVAYRESVVLRHDKGFLTTVMAQPVILLLLYSYGISYTPANVRWAVLDRSGSVASRRLVADIRTTGYFEPPVTVTSYAEGRDLLRRGNSVHRHGDFAADLCPSSRLLALFSAPIRARLRCVASSEAAGTAAVTKLIARSRRSLLTRTF